MYIKVIGSAAGGGLPQWNCRYEFSRRARDGDVNSRTQASIAVSANATDWVIVNASPDLRQQVLTNPELWPRDGEALRTTPISCVVLTGAEVDQIAGLLTLRERQAFSLYATRQTLDILASNPIFNVLAPDVVKRSCLALDTPVELLGPDGTASGIVCEAFSVVGKCPLFQETSSASADDAEEGTTIGLRLSKAETAIHYVPGCAEVDQRLLDNIRGTNCLLFDGTVFTDDELLVAGVGSKTGRRMGHQPISGHDGSMTALQSAKASRRIFTHINNTNPILDSQSSARRLVAEAGWEVAWDGMEIEL